MVAHQRRPGMGVRVRRLQRAARVAASGGRERSRDRVTLQAGGISAGYKVLCGVSSAR
ncbi:hypothetical protein PCAR4_1400010 [Paraburkholderia caribensis]|nr:hypothetical protein PCAR4_1400010 [Paraburkholderia caribensis]